MKRKIWTPDNSFLLMYHGEIESGKIIAGMDLWTELNNLKEDLITQEYEYNTEDAHERMHFMEHCVRLTKSPFYNQPMILMLWQKALIEAAYSFKMPQTGADRFKKVLLLIARKNTKSETCSALALSELINGREGSDIVCSSNDDNQASIVYDAINTMRQLIDPEDLDTKRNQRFIINKVNNSKIFKLSERTKNKEGRNIDFAILDEAHEMLTNNIAKPIEQSQSIKDNPKFVIISTEGFTEDGYLDEEISRSRRIIYKEDDSTNGKRMLPWLYTQDGEWEVWEGNCKNRLWMKSNPTLGIVKKWEYLEEQVDAAKDSKPDRIYVLSKDFNIKQNGVEAWLNLEDYNYKKTYNLEDFRGSMCLGAVDLAETTDMCCAKILLMKEGDRTKYIHTMYFIPASKLEENDDKGEGAKYEEWAREGLITITEGNDIDLSIVADWFYNLYTTWEIRLWKAGYDQRFCKDWINQMGIYGYTKEAEDLIMILQNMETLSNAMKLLESDLKHQIVNYNENKVDCWCYKNAGIKVDDIGRCMCVKQKRGKRIDGAVCNIILYEVYRRYRTEFMRIVKGG